MKTIKAVVLVAILLAVAGMAFAQSSSATLVLKDGEAWINNSSSLGAGYIFQADGTCLSINNYDGVKVGEWTIASKLKWTVVGNNLKIENPDNLSIRSYEFTVSGDTLKLVFLGEPTSYTKTSGINPTTPQYQ